VTDEQTRRRRNRLLNLLARCIDAQQRATTDTTTPDLARDADALSAAIERRLRECCGGPIV
jgi:hypothetical protein